MRPTVLIALAAAAMAAVLIPTGGASARTAGARQVDQTSAAAASSKQFQCAPAAVTPVNNDMEQTCVIAGSSGTCIEKSNSPVVVQTCTFTQAVPGQDHRANAVQVVAVENGGVPVDTLVTQHATQIVNATQTATAGASNFLTATQVIKQSLGPGHFDDTEEAELDTDSSTHQGALALSQESHQIVTADQTADIGSNNSSVSQFSKQRERAVHATVSVDENQNTMPASGQDACPITDDPNANMCALVHQKSGSGPNRSALSQASSQFERAHDTPTGQQTQGMPTTGGMNHEIQQTSTTGTGLCTIGTAQSEHQTQRAVRASVNQVQNGPLRKGVGSSQACSPNSRWTGSQDSAQLATTRPQEADVGSSVFGDPATQNDLLEYFGTTTGRIQATLSVNQKVNNQSTNANTSCSGTSCEAFIACGQAFVVSEGAGGCVTTCPEGEFFNPATGQCEFSDLVLRAPLSARR